ncbi:MAG: inositol monophosphatase family protein [Casimicrobiaceae bacterium]
MNLRASEEASVRSRSHLTFVNELFREYANLTVPLHGAIAAEDKADGSSVTRADRDASALVLKRLNAHTPDHGVISEEESVSYLPGARSQWAVDPLDGTASFARGLPVWGLGMGLLRDSEPMAGYLHFPMVRQTFTFEDDIALLNGKPVPAPPEHLAPDTLNIMITAIHRYVDVRRIEGYRMHNLGSVCYHLMMLAAGRCDAIITGPCYLWDLAPALPFTRALGHVERYLDGSAFRVGDLLVPPYAFPVRQPMLIGPADVVERLIRSLS